MKVITFEAKAISSVYHTNKGFAEAKCSYHSGEVKYASIPLSGKWKPSE
jgi:hypothetical protein